MTLRNLAFLAISFALFLIALLFVGFRLRNARITLRFEQALSRIDTVIDEGGKAAEPAASLLRDGARYARRATDWLSLLKRGYALSNTDPALAILFELAEEAVDDFPGNQAVVALAVHLALRSGYADRGVALAESHLTDPRFDSLKAEAYLAGGLLAESYVQGDGSRESDALLRAVAGGTPEDFEVAFAVTGDYQYRIDAALLYLGDAEMESAGSVLAAMPTDAASELGLLVAYDMGDKDRFDRYFSQAFVAGEFGDRAKLLFADFALRVGDPQEALASYREVEEDVAAVNNAAILTFQENPALGIEFAEAGSRKFPDSGILPETYAKLLWTAGQKDAARIAAAEAAERFPGDGWIAVLEVAAHRETSDPPARVVNQLWRKHLAAVNATPVARYLAWYLFGLRDRAGVTEVLSAHRGEDWTSLYRAAYAADDGLLDDAIEYLADHVAAEDWHYAYNRAVLLTLAGEYENALSDLDSASVQVGECESCLPAAALVAYRRAVALNFLDRQFEAVEAARAALGFDPSLSEARSLLSSLES